MSKFFGGPEKIVLRKDGTMERITPHTFSVPVGIPFPEELEGAILWVLTREFRGFYFAFHTHVGGFSNDPPIRVLMARVWLEGKENERAQYKEMKGRMHELVKMAGSFFSPSSFLANLSNRDFQRSILKTQQKDDFDKVWWVWDSLTKEGEEK